MIHNKLQHCFFGLVVFAVGIVGGLSVSMSPIISEGVSRSLQDLQITLDESKVQQFFEGRLPDMENLERDRIDAIHRRVGKLWKQHRHSEMREDVVHLAAWYSLAADKCFRHEDRTWLDHVLL